MGASWWRSRRQQRYEAALKEWKALDDQLQAIARSFPIGDGPVMATSEALREWMRLIRERDEAFVRYRLAEQELFMGPPPEETE